MAKKNVSENYVFVDVSITYLYCYIVDSKVEDPTILVRGYISR